MALVGTDNEPYNLNSSYSGLWLGAAPAGPPTAARSLPPARPTDWAAAATPDGFAAMTGNNSLLRLRQGGRGTVILRGQHVQRRHDVGSNGILQFGQTVAMPDAGTVTVNPGATLAVNVGGAGEFNAGPGNGSLGGLLRRRRPGAA